MKGCRDRIVELVATKQRQRTTPSKPVNLPRYFPRSTQTLSETDEILLLSEFVIRLCRTFAVALPDRIHELVVAFREMVPWEPRITFITRRQIIV